MQLLLNADSLIIQSLADMMLEYSKAELVDDFLLLLCCNALLYEDCLRDQQTRSLLYCRVLHLMKTGMEIWKKLQEQDQRRLAFEQETLNAVKDLTSHYAVLLEKYQKQENQISQVHSDLKTMQTNCRKSHSEICNQSVKHGEKKLTNHIVFFLITPFSDTYEAVRTAVKRVFACAPFCFEVRAADEYRGGKTLWENIQYHMKHAHGFVAEISEQNPNVMMEVGAVYGDGRLLLPLEIHPRMKQEAADLKGSLKLHYSADAHTPEKIAEELRNQLYDKTRGSIRSDEIRRLIETQRRALFLSDILLESILKPEHAGLLLKQIHPCTVETYLNLTKEELREKAAIARISAYRAEEIHEFLDKIRKECNLDG